MKRGFDARAALRSLGGSGNAQMNESNCTQTRRFAEKLVAADRVILNNVVRNQILVSFGDAEHSKARNRGDPNLRQLLGQLTL